MYCAYDFHRIAAKTLVSQHHYVRDLVTFLSLFFSKQMETFNKYMKQDAKQTCQMIFLFLQIQEILYLLWHYVTIVETKRGHHLRGSLNTNFSIIHSGYARPCLKTDFWENISRAISRSLLFFLHALNMQEACIAVSCIKLNQRGKEMVGRLWQ